MSQFNLRYVPTLSCNELILNGQRVNTQAAVIQGNLTTALSTEIIINDDTKNQQLYEDILDLQNEIGGNVNPNLVVVNQRLTALEGNVAILQGNVISIENDIVVIEGNIDTIEGDIVVLQNQIDLLGNIEQGLVGNTQFLIAPYNGLAGNTSFFFKGLQVYNTPGLAINENTGTGIFSYLDDAGPTGQIQHRVQNNREFQIKNGTTRINPSTNGSVIIQTTDNSPFNFVMGNSSSTYEQQQAVNCNISGTVNIGLGFQAGPTTVTRGLEIKNTNDVLTTTLSGSDLNVFGGIGGAVNVYSQDGGQLNIQSNVATLSGGVVICGGGSQAILSCPGQTDVFGSSTNITSSENTNIFSENGKRIDINCNVGSDNSEINIGTLQTTAQTGYQIISIGSQPTVPLSTAQTSTFIYGDLYRPFPISFNFPYDQMLYIGLPTPFSGPTNGPVKSTVNPFLRSISTFAPDYTVNSFIASSGFFTVNVGIGAIAMNCGAGGFALSVVAGPLALTSLIGGVAVTTGAGAIALTTGTGTVQISTGAAPIQMETVFGDILLKAGYAASAVPETALGSIYLKSRNYTFITPDQAVVVGANIEQPFNEVLINTLDYPFFGNLLTPPGLNGNSVLSNVFLTPNVKTNFENPIQANLFYSGNIIGQTGSAQAFIHFASNNTVISASTVATVPYKGNLEGNVIQGNIEPTRFTFENPFTTDLPLNANVYVRIAPTILLDANLELSRYGYGTWQSDTSIQSNIGVFVNGFIQPAAPTYDRYLTVLDDASFLNDVECNSNILVKKDAFPLKNTTITNDSISTTGNITCNTLNYVNLNPPVGGGTPALQKGGLITNDGTTDVAFPNAAFALNTTSTLVDWTVLTVGLSEIFTFTSTPSIYVQNGKSIRIRYNSTDFLDGIVTSVAGNNVTLQITALNSAVYSRTNVLSAGTSATPQYVTSTGPFPNKPGENIPPNSFVWFIEINCLFNSDLPFGTPSTVNASLINPSSVVVATSVNFTAPAGILFLNPQLGLTIGKGLLYNSGSFSVQYTLVSGSNLTQYGTGPTFWLGQILGFTLPYSSGSVELLSPLVLSSNINTSTSLEWQYPADFNTVSGGTNIIVTGNTVNSIINLRNPLTAELNMGSQSLRDSTNSVGLSGQVLSAGAGGSTQWTTGVPSGSISITDTNTNATFFPTFVSGAGVQNVLADVSTGPISLNPSNGDFNLVDTIKITQSQLSIGKGAGATTQGTQGIAIGLNAAQTNQASNCVAIGGGAGALNQQLSAVAIGNGAGNTTQGQFCVAIGVASGTNTQETAAIAIGNQAGFTTQRNSAVAIGNAAGTTNQGQLAVSVGSSAGQNNQAANAVAIGASAGSSTQSTNSVAIGISAGSNSQGANSVAVGNNAGNFTQGANSCAVGRNAGAGVSGTNFQGDNACAFGHNAGQNTQGVNSVAVGHNAAQTSQGTNCVAVGHNAGQNTQGANSVAVGHNSGQTTQGTNAVAIGNGAGNSGLGTSSIAIGRLAGELNQSANSICINASGVALNPATTGLFIDPIRNVSQGNVIGYDSINKELTFFTTPGSSNIPVLTKGELITNDGTNNVALDAPSSTIITTTTVYDWTGPTFIGTTKVYTMSSVANLRLTDVIRINYSLTDFVVGTITNISGSDISLLISNQGNQAYLSGAFYTNQDGSTLYTFTPVLNSETNLPSACIVTGLQGNYQQNPFGTAATVSATFNTASSGNLANLDFFIPGGGFGPSFFTTNLSVPAGSGVFVNNPSPFTISFSSPGSTSISWRITSTGNFYWGDILGYTLAYSSGTVENLSFPLPPFILQANPLTSTGLEWQISQSTLNPYAGTGINNLSYDPLTKRLFQAELNANFFEDFWINIFGTSTTEFGQVLVFNETGTGVTSRFNGVIKPAAITGSLGRRGFIQINSGGAAGNSSFFKTPNEIAISTIKKVTWGILCSANENLATNAIAAGNIHQAVGITSATNATNVQTADTILWRLFSNSGTLPGWQFIINNTIQYSLLMTPIGQTDQWITCGFEMISMNLTNNTFTVRGFWKNNITNVVEFTPIITCGVGAAGNLANFPTNLQNANEVGLYAMSGTNNATNKYLGVDYVLLESQNLFQVINI